MYSDRKITNHPYKDVQPLPHFDWEAFEQEYSPHLKPIKGLSTKNGDKVFKNYPNLEEVYLAYQGYTGGISSVYGKEVIKGNLIAVTSIEVIKPENFSRRTEIQSEFHVLAKTNVGQTFRIDLEKERAWCNLYFGLTPKSLWKELYVNPSIVEQEEFKDAFFVYVNSTSNVSLYKGHIEKLKIDMVDVIKHNAKDKTNVISFEATITNTNKGGFIVDIEGLECFMPFSQSGIPYLENNEIYIGNTYTVVPITQGHLNSFVVSHKIYKSCVASISASTFAGKAQSFPATIVSINQSGAFCEFNVDVNGTKILMQGLIHYSNMSSALRDGIRNNQIFERSIVDVYIKEVTKREQLILTDIAPKVSE